MQEESLHLETFARALRSLIDDIPGGQKAVAAGCGLSTTAISFYVNAKRMPGAAELHSLARFLGVTMESLLSGHPKKIAKAKTSEIPTDAPPQPAMWGGAFWGTTNLVPIISWASAGAANAYEDHGHDVPTIPSKCPDPNCYALEVEGSSMEPLYETGDIVVVMPNVQAQNGQLVVARLEDDSVYFKKLLIGRDPARIKLVSFNPKFEPIDAHRREVRFIHPVHSMVRIFLPQNS